eukprot:1241017-Alexandrium_andersonii.AAC.1
MALHAASHTLSASPPKVNSAGAANGPWDVQLRKATNKSVEFRDCWWASSRARLDTPRARGRSQRRAAASTRALSEKGRARTLARGASWSAPEPER